MLKLTYPPDEQLSKRGQIAKAYLEGRLTRSQLDEIVKSMTGKTIQEKEALAAQLIEQLSSETKGNDG